MRCFYSQDLELELPVAGPFALGRFRMAKDMLLESGILRPDEIVDVSQALSHRLERVHARDYVERVAKGQLGRKEQILLGLGVSRDWYRRSASEVEATRLACHAALTEGVGVCLAGGTAHAFHHHGEEGCVFNDIAVAIRDVQLSRPGIKVMVVDTHARPGNGTAALLADDPRVFTYSIHAAGHGSMHPARGSLDVETLRYVEGAMYLQQLFQSLAAALETFAPDLVIWVSGVDNHRNDLLGNMQLSLKDLQRRDEVLLGALIRNRIPVAILYGGGANRQPEFTAKLHRNTVATAKKLAAQYRGL